METVAHLGGRCCQCGYREDHRAFAIDHVKGDGAEMRRSGLSGRRLLRAALSNAKGQFQLLCWNCNAIKRVANNESGSRVTTRRPPPSDWPDKWCSKCLITQPVAAFYRNCAAHDGLTTYCAACTNELNKQTYQAARLRAIEHCGGECKTCGYTEDHRALVFDHVNGGGKAERKSGVVPPRALFNAVLVDTVGKYQLLCANCNQIKQFENGERVGKRVWKRNIPTGRTIRPDGRRDPELLAMRADQFRQQMLKMWQDPAHRALMAEKMAARKSSGEVLFQKKAD